MTTARGCCSSSDTFQHLVFYLHKAADNDDFGDKRNTEHKRSSDFHQRDRCEQVLQADLPHHTKASSKGTETPQCYPESGHSVKKRSKNSRLHSHLDKQALNLVLETSAFILEQAVYHNVKPASLQQQLEAVHLNPDKAEMLAQTWATSGPELVERLKHNVFAPKKAQPFPASHLSSDAVEASRPNKSHMVYYYGLSLHHKTLNCPALTQCC
ncbi:COMM domain-containing protein 10 [Larimichthys crocea]|uniref:Uncharacterized protein n=1 Tax=Larimichthys crocea TaxID=215358 RepID=A0ACD3Q9M5_LARCR|nr:COMM domain-containing protein 10 [Larimichthys crocea]